MNLYKIGKVVTVSKGYIIFESNYAGYIIHVARSEDWEANTNRKIYVFNYETEYLKSIYGFATFSERILFEDLIDITGVGPKTAFNILKEGESNVSAMIANGLIDELAKIPNVGMKIAKQIIFALQEKYVKYQNFDKSTSAKYNPKDIINSLKTLGFNKNQIDFAITKIKPSGSLEDMVENAIKVIANEKFA